MKAGSAGAASAANDAPANTQTQQGGSAQGTSATASAPNAPAPGSLAAELIAIENGEETPAETTSGGNGQPGDQPNGNENDNEQHGTDGTSEGARDSGQERQDDDGAEDRGREEGGKPEGASEEDEPEAQLSDEEKQALPDWVMPRIHKASAKATERLKRAEAAEAKAKELERERDELKAKAEGVAPIVVQPNASDPLADVETPEDLQRAISELEQGLEWAELNVDGIAGATVGYDPEGKPVKRDFSAEEMKQQKLFYSRALRNAVPAKALHLQKRNLAASEARKRLPAMFQKDTAERRDYEAFVRVLPEFKRLPHHELIAAVLIPHWNALMAELKAESPEQGAEAETPARKVDPKVAPFLEKRPPIAQGAANVRSASSGNGNGGGRVGKQEIEKARERVQAGEGEDAELELLDKLMSSQRAGSGRAALV